MKLRTQLYVPIHTKDNTASIELIIDAIPQEIYPDFLHNATNLINDLIESYIPDPEPLSNVSNLEEFKKAC